MAWQKKSEGVRLSNHFKPYAFQQRCMESTAPFRLMGGSKGPGKSFGLMWLAIATCLRIPGCNVLLLRRTYPELRKGILRHFELYVPPAIYGGKRNYNKSENVVNFLNGSKLFFGHAQHEKDVLDFNGHEYVAILIDESTEFTFFMYQFLCAQLRCPIEFDSVGDPVVPFMVLGTNPIGVGHDWHKALFIGELQPDGSRKRNLETVQKVLRDVDGYDPAEFEYFPATLDDNLTYAKGTKLGDDYRKKLDKLPEFLKEAYIKGSWDTNNGRYFVRYDHTEVEIDSLTAMELVKTQPWHKKWIGFDWGFNDFTAVYWGATITLMTEDGGKYDVTCIYREHVTRMTDSETLAKEVCDMTDERIETVYMSPDTKEKRDSQNTIRETIGNYFIKNGLPYPQDADTDRVGGARLLDELMAHNIPDPNHADRTITLPLLRISTDCAELLQAIPKLMRDDKNPNDVLKHKRDNDPTDDIYDAWRYCVKSKFEAGNVPFSVMRQRMLAECSTNQERFWVDTNLKLGKRHDGFVRFGRKSYTRNSGRSS